MSRTGMSITKTETLPNTTRRWTRSEIGDSSSNSKRTTTTATQTKNKNKIKTKSSSISSNNKSARRPRASFPAQLWPSQKINRSLQCNAALARAYYHARTHPKPPGAHRAGSDRGGRRAANPGRKSELQPQN
mmetsp:Transcript_91009/g.199380  ORF Transcript_91009/g.199380 Transcript_91009/m.199380 type:complete len:132 (-) Transcript_91009:365-760(-)